jgi:hypothetical protein
VKRLLLVVCLAAISAATAAPPAEPRPAGQDQPAAKGGVDWQAQVLTATGSGAPDLRAVTAAQARLGAERAAKMDALRNLLAQAKGLQLESGKTLGDALADEATRGHVQGVLKGFKVTHKRYYSDNGVEIDVEVPLSGVLAAIPAAPAEPAGEVVPAKGHATRATGLIVDARGLSLTPALLPRLLDPEGKAVYSRATVTEAKATVAGYFESVAAAKASKRVGPHPLIVKATAVKGADLVLGAKDVAALQADRAFLAQGKVAIVSEGVGR